MKKDATDLRHEMSKRGLTHTLFGTAFMRLRAHDKIISGLKEIRWNLCFPHKEYYQYKNLNKIKWCARSSFLCEK